MSTEPNIADDFATQMRKIANDAGMSLPELMRKLDADGFEGIEVDHLPPFNLTREPDLQ